MTAFNDIHGLIERLYIGRTASSTMMLLLFFPFSVFFSLFFSLFFFFLFLISLREESIILVMVTTRRKKNGARREGGKEVSVSTSGNRRKEKACECFCFVVISWVRVQIGIKLVRFVVMNAFFFLPFSFLSLSLFLPSISSFLSLLTISYLSPRGSCPPPPPPPRFHFPSNQYHNPTLLYSVLTFHFISFRRRQQEHDTTISQFLYRFSFLFFSFHAIEVSEWVR